MSELLYLVAAVAISVIGVLLLRVMRRDQTPKTLGGTIDQFSRGLQALAPDKPVRTKKPTRSRRPIEGENVG